MSKSGNPAKRDEEKKSRKKPVDKQKLFLRVTVSLMILALLGSGLAVGFGSY